MKIVILSGLCIQKRKKGSEVGMTIEELKKFRNEVFSMAVEPPWCENVDILKKWVEGFETCQGQIIAIIDSKIKNLDQQRC